MRNSNIVIYVVLICCCSTNAFKIKPRIVDGQKADSGQFPYYAYLDIKLSNGSNAVCGASIISDEWLISAAHCLNNAQSVNVHVGDYLLNKPEPGHTPIVVQPNGFHSHPQNDIGIFDIITFSTFYTKFIKLKFLLLKRSINSSVTKNCVFDICTASTFSHKL